MKGPVEFEIVLRHHDDNMLKPIVDWMLSEGGHNSFMIMREKDDIFELSIQSHGASNLGQIANLINEEDEDENQSEDK